MAGVLGCERIGFVMSAGAAPLEAALGVLGTSGNGAHLFLRRSCGAELVGQRRRMHIHRIFDRVGDQFSTEAAAIVRDVGINVLFFSFDRLVSPELFEATSCINIHPSLLPSFSGFSAVKRALEQRSQVLGASAHLITSGVDEGPILVQTARAIRPHERTTETADAISFLQKTLVLSISIQVCLSELAVDTGPVDAGCLTAAFDKTSSGTLSTNPALAGVDVCARFAELQDRLGIVVDPFYAQFSQSNPR